MQTIATPVVLLVGYFVVPFDGRRWAAATALGVLSAAAVLPLTFRRVRRIQSSDHPVGEALAAVSLLASLVVVGFSIGSAISATDLSTAGARVVRRGVGPGFGASTVDSRVSLTVFAATRRRIGIATGGADVTPPASAVAPADSDAARASALPSPAVLRRRVGGFGRPLSSMRRV